MWFSQLAYEADSTPNPTIDVVAALGLYFGYAFCKAEGRHHGELRDHWAGRRAAGRSRSAFAGTDPAVWQTLVTDANVWLNRDTDTHIGFQTHYNWLSNDGGL
jgi:hypothetical protein